MRRLLLTGLVVVIACSLPPAPDRAAAPAHEVAAASAASTATREAPSAAEVAATTEPATASAPLAAADARLAAPGPRGPQNPLSPAAHAPRAEAIADLDEGRDDHALAVRRELVDRYPSNPAVRGLHEAAVQASAAMAEAASASLALRPALRLERPPFVHTVRRPLTLADAGPMPTLRRLVERRNGITDDEAWLDRNGLDAGVLRTFAVPNPFFNHPGALPDGIPPKYGAQLLVRGIDHGDHTVLIYGDDFGDGRTVAVLGPARELVALFDFSAWLEPDAFVASDRGYVDEVVLWAEARDGVLYVANGHRTYAASSKGHNAYLSALDLASGELLWRSPPLVHNALPFVIHGPAIFTGYGFTAEPDFVYVVDRRDGAVVRKTPVKSGPDALVVAEGKLYVRTYDHDYVFAIE